MLNLNKNIVQGRDQHSLQQFIVDTVYDNIVIDNKMFSNYRFIYDNQFYEIRNNNQVITYSELGFNNDDIVLRSKAFIKSFFLFDFWNGKSEMNSEIVFSFRKNITYNEEFFDNNILLNADMIPVLITIDKEGQNILGNELRFLDDLEDIYLKVSFFNAKTGELTNLSRKRNLSIYERGIPLLFSNNKYNYDYNAIDYNILNNRFKLILHED
jgi:hypothetical protein